MQKAIGLILLGSGLSYVLYANATTSLDREAQVAAMTRIVAQGVHIEPVMVAAEQPGLRRAVVPSNSSVSTFAAPALSTAAIPRPEIRVDPVTAAEPAAGPWETSLEPVPVPARAVSLPAPTAGEKTQRQLARQIQSELKRVGCYTGALDGSWGDRSRAAMTAFIARVNASLPTREPDVILLSLIKGQSGAVCGVACRAGDVAAGGRCVPRAVVAAADPIPAAAPIEVAAAVADPLPGRMSIGGPVPRSDVRADAPGTEWPAPSGERLPWRDPAPRGASAPSGSPGAPALASLDDDDPAVPVATQPEAAITGLPGEPDTLGAPPPRKAAKAYRVRPAYASRDGLPKQIKKRRYARSVQNLFMHPLGRM